jgi:uncharacterized protein
MTYMDSSPQDIQIKIFDSHAHIYSPKVINNVMKLEGLAAAIGLDVAGAMQRLDKVSLMQESEAAGVEACLLLPTSPANRVRQTNELALQTIDGERNLYSAGTLHPSAAGMDREIEWLADRGIRALKLCSFSQDFDLDAEDTLRLFEMIRACNICRNGPFFVVLDTFYRADIYFRASARHLTTPEKLSRLAARFPEINFIGAHMGGLAAPYSEIEQYLIPQCNLYLDTSNASHILTREQFIHLLQIHGPERILFGTDWPWFGHKQEVGKIRTLLQDAGYSMQDQAKVFSGNICRLLGIHRSGT